MISTREGLKDYCLRRLGWPVIEINVDDDQVEDRIQDAIEFWHEYHFDGVEKMFLKAQVIASTLDIVESNAPQFVPGVEIVGQTSGATALVYNSEGLTKLILKKVEGVFLNGEIVIQTGSGVTATAAAANAFFLGNWDTQYFDISDAVTGITRIFAVGPSGIGGNPRNMFDVVYQFRLTDMYNLLGSDMVYYTQVKMHLQMLEMILPGERSIRFNRKMNRLYVDTNWYETFNPGDYVVAECFRILDPEQFTEVYNDLFLKRYATALIKRQWAANMSKFDGIQLPGGVTLKGTQLYEEASTEILKIEEEMKDRYELPIDFQVG